MEGRLFILRARNDVGEEHNVYLNALHKREAKRKCKGILYKLGFISSEIEARVSSDVFEEPDLDEQALQDYVNVILEKIDEIAHPYKRQNFTSPF